jgi:hypothetical protein
MDFAVALVTYDERFALHGNHPRHPRWFFFPSAPSLFQVRQFANMVDFTVFSRATQFTDVSLKTLDKVGAIFKRYKVTA